MPWVKQEDCIGCGICVEECPVDAISIENEKAYIDMEECIRCGKCHENCLQEAVRHDSEKIPAEIEENIEKTKWLLQHYDNKKEKQKPLERMIKHFNKQKIVAEKTIEKINSIKEQM